MKKYSQTMKRTFSHDFNMVQLQHLRKEKNSKKQVKFVIRTAKKLFTIKEEYGNITKYENLADIQDQESPTGS